MAELAVENLSGIMEAAGVDPREFGLEANIDTAENFRLPTSEELGEFAKRLGTNEMSGIMKEITKNIPQNITVPSSSQEQMTQVKGALNNVNISSIVSQMSNDPGKLTNAVEESAKVMTPEMLQQAEKMARGSQGEKIRREMEKTGMSAKQIQADFKAQQKIAREASAKQAGPLKTACVLTIGRKFKTRQIPQSEDVKELSKILQCQEAVKMPFSRLARGPLKNRAISVWRNPDDTRKNKRVQKLCGFPAGGEIIISADNGSLTIAEIEAVEKML